MKKIAFFDAKSYDILSFDKLNNKYEITYYENRLTEDSVILAKGKDAVCVFVNDEVNASVVDKLYEYGIRLIILRCAGYNNVDLKACNGKITVLRVPAYSPNAVAEHAMALLLTLNRRIHKAYLRTRDFNFNISGLTGFNLAGKKIGVIGTGKIGYAFAKICLGFQMEVMAYDPYPNEKLGLNYYPLQTVLKEANIISLHCPLTNTTKHLVNEESIKKMQNNVVIINTSRGGLIESRALLEGLKSGKIKAAGLDVYEEEADLFYEDNSDKIIADDVLSLLISLPNVIITSHQGYLTDEALENIASVSLANLDAFFTGGELENIVQYQK